MQGHALTLAICWAAICVMRMEVISARRDQVTFFEADSEEQGGHAFRVMDAYVKWREDGENGDADADVAANEDTKQRGRIALALLKLMGLFDRPATKDCLAALWQAPVIDRV